MRLAVLKERRAFETRVAVTPETAKRLSGLGLSVAVEAAAGAETAFPDADYAAETASLVRANVLRQAGIAVAAQANADPQRVLSLLSGL